MKQLALGVKLRADAVFASFALGSNAELVAALRRDGSVQDGVPQDGATHVSATHVGATHVGHGQGGSGPIWLWGAPGTGKTHLLQAVCAEVGATTAYFPLRRDLGLPPEALQGFESRLVLCVDDTDAVAGDLDWERALFRLYNEASEFGTRLVFAARAAPRSVAWCLEDWKSRASACEVYQLRELDEDGRIEALSLRAAQRGLQLPRETAEYLLRRVPRDLPSLLDLLDALDDASLAAQRRLTIPFIRAAFEKSADTRP